MIYIYSMSSFYTKDIRISFRISWIIVFFICYFFVGGNLKTGFNTLYKLEPKALYASMVIS